MGIFMFILGTLLVVGISLAGEEPDEERVRSTLLRGRTTVRTSQRGQGLVPRFSLSIHRLGGDDGGGGCGVLVRGS